MKKYAIPFLYPQAASRSVILCIAVVLALAVSAGCSKSSGKAGEGGQFSDEDLALNQPEYGEGNIPQAQEGGLFPDVRFGYDSSVVPPEYQEQLRESAKALSADKTLRAEIEGHCDKRGTNEYNLALGAQRAKAVASLLLSYGVSPNQLSTISYGEEIPLDPADNESAYAKNRRAHFALYRSKGAQ